MSLWGRGGRAGPHGSLARLSDGGSEATSDSQVDVQLPQGPLPLSRSSKLATSHRRSPRVGSDLGSDPDPSHGSRSSTRSSPRNTSTSDVGDSHPRANLGEQTFLLHGQPHKVMLDNQGINLTRASASGCCTPRSFMLHSQHFAFHEIIRAGIADAQHGNCLPTQQNFSYKRASYLVIHSFKRGNSNPNDWQPLELVLEHKVDEIVLQWANTINDRVKCLTAGTRPKRLRVWINPFGGRRQAQQIWEKKCVPIFESAGVKVRRTITNRAGHARDEVEAMAVEELTTLDGLVVVGGDGLFSEVLNSILKVRSSGGARGAAAARLRLGHIPAGSTDAVAYSINGTRQAVAAALHIVLGDRMPLDCLRIDAQSSTAPHFSCCLASAGFLGEVLHASEQMRWAGPARYDIAGLYAFLKHGTYRIRVRYLPVREEPNASSSTTQDGEESSRQTQLRPCNSGCDVCRANVGFNSAETLPLEHQRPPLWVAHSMTQLDSHPERVKTVEGRFKGLMCVVQPCRSDKSVHGVAPMAHLADGQMSLIMIKECNHLQYLRFLVMLTRTGVIPGRLSGFVEVIECEAVHVEPLDNKCKWNVDGEPMEQRTMSAQVHRGLVDVFARGVEARCD